MMHGSFSNQMTDAQFDAERAKLRERGESSTERTARWEQDLANLYYRSGWTQEALAEKEQKTQSWISRRIVFGRFLNFMQEAHKPEKLPPDLNHGRFRKSGRTSPDVSGAYQGLYPALHGVPRAVANLGVEGIVWYRRYIEGVPVPSGDSQYSIFGETGLHSFIVWLGDVFTIKTPELRRASIVSAMYHTFITNELAAKTFWAEVARGGIEFEDNHPTTVLDGWLKRVKEDKDNPIRSPASSIRPAFSRGTRSARRRRSRTSSAMSARVITPRISE
jgi:hypothetical protein